MLSLDQELNKNLVVFDDAEFFKKIPRPILNSYLKIEKQTNAKLALQDLCLSLIPLTFQYYALLLSSEYLNSESPPSYKVTESLWNMIRRPGPGKWVGFIREAVIHFINNETAVIDKKAINQFYETLIAKDKPIITLLDQSGKSQKNKIFGKP